ncbi:peptide chain release factor N(5)-glutamine methyltransferase [Rhizobacter fulvus]
MTTVASALHEARIAGVERLDAQLLLAHVLARPRAWLYAHDDAAIDAAQALTWRGLLARRAAGEPVAYLIGRKEFHGLTLQVDKRVLVPRPETELLVDWALDRLTDAATSHPRVVDLGTGSGAVALAVKAAWPQADVLATDVSEDALAVARANADALGLPLATCSGAWWDALDGERFDLVLSNPPYIAGGDPHLPALRHEPALALTPGGDGLDALRIIVAGAAVHLRAGGWLLLEHGYDQADAVQALLREHGFDGIETRCDLAGQPRCTGGRKLAATERTG